MNVDPSEYVVLKKSDIIAAFKGEDKFINNTHSNLSQALDDWMEERRMNMWTIPEFQKDMVEKTFRWFPEVIKNGEIDLHMLIYGICGEAGEIADEMKKFLRGSRT